MINRLRVKMKSSLSYNYSRTYTGLVGTKIMMRLHCRPISNSINLISAVLEMKHEGGKKCRSHLFIVCPFHALQISRA